MANEFPKNKIALPSVGRIVHVFVTNTEPVHPMAAIVTCVPDEARPLTIHTCVFWPTGTPAGMKDVPHKSQAAEHGEMYWDWMDYQKGQAAKTEELQAELQKRAADPSFVSELSKTQAGAPSPVDGKR